MQDAIYGNHVRIRLSRGGGGRPAQLIGFVHNADSESVALLNIADEWLDLIGDTAGPRTTAKRRGRWLVVMSGRGMSWLAAYRCIYSQLRLPSDFKKIFLAFADGRVATLTDESA